MIFSYDKNHHKERKFNLLIPVRFRHIYVILLTERCEKGQQSLCLKTLFLCLAVRNRNQEFAAAFHGVDPSFSKMTEMLFSFSFRIYCRASTVFLANLLTDSIVHHIYHSSITKVIEPVNIFPNTKATECHHNIQWLITLIFTCFYRFSSFTTTSQWGVCFRCF